MTILRVNDDESESAVLVDVPDGWRPVEDEGHDGEPRLRDAEGNFRELIPLPDGSTIIAVGPFDDVALEIVGRGGVN